MMNAMGMIEASPRRGVIASKTRALSIIARIASKHALSVNQVLLGKRVASAKYARQEASVALQEELGWSYRMIGELLGCSHVAVCKLQSYHKMTQESARRILAVDEAQRYEAIERDELMNRVRLLEQERKAFTGELLAEVLHRNLEIVQRCAIVLAICVEHAPRPVRVNFVIQLYDEACISLGYGYRNGATEQLVTKNFSDLCKIFRERGWPQPVKPGPVMGSRILTDECSKWLDSRLIQPIQRAA